MTAGSAEAEPAVAPKPFLRRGSGWEARMTAAREGRRYVPRGGPVKDYSQEEEAPLPRRKRAAAAAVSRIPRSPAKAPAGRGTLTSSGGRQTGAGASARAAPTQHQSHARQRPAPPSHMPMPSEAPLNRGKARHVIAAQPAAPPTAGNAWARKLLRGSSLPPQQQSTCMQLRQPDEASELEEFEALESQVLKEVVNSTRPRSTTASPAAGRKACESGHGGSGNLAAAEGDGTHEAEEEEDVHDVFQSDEEGDVRCAFTENHQAQAAAAGIGHPLAQRHLSFLGCDGGALVQQLSAGGKLQPPPAHFTQGQAQEEEEEEEEEMPTESCFIQGVPSSALVRQFFSRPIQPTAASMMGCSQPQLRQVQQPLPPQHLWQAGMAPMHLPARAQNATLDPQQQMAVPPQGQEEAVEQLQQEVVRLQEERARVARLRMELDEGMARLGQEQAAFEKRKMEEAARFEAERSEELRKLQRDRRVLEKQSRAILKLPTKQSKEEVAAVEALLADERRTGRAREARHKLTVERLRQQVLELQGRNGELQEQVAYLEQQQLQQAWGSSSQKQGAAVPSKNGSPEGSAPAADRIAAGRSSAAAADGTAVAGERVVKPSRGLPQGSISNAASNFAAAPAPAAQRMTSNRATYSHSGAQQEELYHGLRQKQSLGQHAGWSAGEEEDADAEVVLPEEGPTSDFEDTEGQQTAVDSRGVACGIPGDRRECQSALAPSAMPSLADAAAQEQEPVVARSPHMAGSTDGPMAKAASALARFNQLRQSLVRHGGVHSCPVSQTASPQRSPQLTATAAPAVASAAGMSSSRNPAPAVASAAATNQADSHASGEDDLRRLGRTLLAASGACTAEQQQATLPSQTSAAPSPVPGSAGDAVLSEVSHSDGRSERVYASGMREQCFTNGSVRTSLPSGAAMTRFSNGDVKKVLPCGTVEYWYAEVASWQVTHPSGVEVFFFASGQVEAHHPGGIKEVLYSSGAVRKVLPDGRELTISAAHLSREIQEPQPVPQLL